MFILQRMRALIRDDSGPTSVEYAVMLALIAMGALIAVQTLGNTINAMVEDLHETISGVFPD
jgi:Flp pilus assembly pilin Flp